MPALEQVFQLNPQSLLQELPVYQRDIVSVIISKHPEPDSAVIMWLSAFPPGTEPFGGEQENPQWRTLYVEKFMGELEAFLCGGPQYETERAKLTSNTTQAGLISVISAGVGATLGASATFIMPMVIIILACMGKMSVNAWCAARREVRKLPPNS